MAGCQIRCAWGYFRDANTGAGQGITDLAAAVQLRLRVASGLQTFTVKSRLLTGENAVQLASGVMMMPGLMVLIRAPRFPQRTASAITRNEFPRFEI